MLRRLWLLLAQLFTLAMAVYGAYSLIVEHTPKTASPVPETTTQSAPKAWDMSFAAEKAAPSVVTIQTRATQTERSEAPDRVQELFTEHALETIGSGVIVNPDGYVLTNQHVINGFTDLIVTLNNGQRFHGQILNADKDTDLAMIKILANNLPAIEMANTETIKVGHPVLAIGNPFAVGQTVTAGIISGLGRHGFGLNNYEDFIQTDAAINQGNSGGALVDAEGKLVGINTAIFSPDASEGFIGIGFAIPVSMIQKVLTNLMSGNRLERGYIGIVPQQITPEFARDLGLEVTNGVMVSSVIQGSPASRAGLRAFDVIVRVGDEDIYQMTRLLDVIAGLTPEKEITMKVLRGKTLHTITIKPSKRPDNPLKQPSNEAVLNVA